MPSQSSECTENIFSVTRFSQDPIQNYFWKQQTKGGMRTQQQTVPWQSLLPTTTAMDQWEVIVRERDVYFNANHKLTPHPYLNINQKRLAWSCLFWCLSMVLEIQFFVAFWLLRGCFSALLVLLHPCRQSTESSYGNSQLWWCLSSSEEKEESTDSIFHLNWTSLFDAIVSINSSLQPSWDFNWCGRHAYLLLNSVEELVGMVICAKQSFIVNHSVV